MSLNMSRISLLVSSLEAVAWAKGVDVALVLPPFVGSSMFSIGCRERPSRSWLGRLTWDWECERRRAFELLGSKGSRRVGSPARVYNKKKRRFNGLDLAFVPKSGDGC